LAFRFSRRAQTKSGDDPMKRLLVPAILAVMLVGNPARCTADIVLSYTISDGSGDPSHQVSAEETSPIGTPFRQGALEGTEYDFAFGPVTNNNWNWSAGKGQIELRWFGNNFHAGSVEMYLTGADKSPFTVTFLGPNNSKSDFVDIDFSARFSPIPVAAGYAALRGEIRGKKLVAAPAMAATAMGAGKIGTVGFNSAIGPRFFPWPSYATGLDGNINFAWNTFAGKGDTVSFNHAMVGVSGANPEPSSIVMAIIGGLFALGVWSARYRRRVAA
jgi:hypothetical protein